MTHQPATPPRVSRHVAVLAFEGCEILDVCGPLEMFGMANIWLKLSGQAEVPPYVLSILAERAGPVTTLSGLRIMADRAIAEMDEDIDTLLVAGGPGVETARRNREILDWLSQMAGRVRRVGSVCTGAFLLAQCGLLEGRRATTHWYWCRQLADEFPNVRVEPDCIAIRDGFVYSSGGVTAGMDLGLTLVEEDLGRETAVMIGRWVLVFPSRPGGQSQFSACLVKGSGASRDFLALQDWIVAHPAEDLSVEALAHRMNMSPRNFARTFDREVGLTPARFVELARLESARARLEQTLLPVETVAGQCGFGTPEHMRRAFQRVLKVSPQDYRARFRSPGHRLQPKSDQKFSETVS